MKTKQELFKLISERKLTIEVIGLGYIGLPTAAIFASRGYSVIGVDVNKKVVETVNNGQVPIIEPELDILVHSVVSTGKLTALNYVKQADVFIICVPTPFKKEHKADLSFVFSATKSIAKVLGRNNIVVLESTSPPGSTLKVAKLLEEITHLKAGKDFYIAYCPERVLPGKILKEAVQNSRIIGGIDANSSEIVNKLYSSFVEGEISITDSTTAEMVKLAENTYRDINIAYANELSIICQKLEINIWELIKLANRHPRVNIHRPGPGVGGHCIAVDPWFVVENFPKEARLIKMARLVNDQKPNYIVSYINDNLKLSGRKKLKVGLLGMTYKQNVDDFRESPSIGIAKQLQKNRAISLMVNDPFLSNYHEERLGIINSPIQRLIRESELIVFLVAHEQYKSINVLGKKILDCCGLIREVKNEA